MLENKTELPNFVIDKLPTVRIKSLSFKNFKAFENHTFNFKHDNEIKDFVCLIGPNGSGKSTILNAIQLIFTRFEGRTEDRIKENLSPLIRHVCKERVGALDEKSFSLRAEIGSSLGDYEVEINKRGFVKDHPPAIKELAYRLCYTARFDQELQKFQLAREKWPIFKNLFESVTGFTIEEDHDINKYFSGTQDATLKSLIENFVLAFYIKKPNEIIHQKEASDGERKIIKSFSTLLTIDYTPQIILIDNIEMHVERRRHMSLIKAMKKCFPNSQIFSTTHSYYVSKLLGKNAGIEDLRLVHTEASIRQQPWKLRVIDEIEDALIKLEAIGAPEKIIEDGKKLLVECHGVINDLQSFKNTLKIFLQEVLFLFVNDVIS
jgi:AAA15 family ATPase/GTPase